MSTIFYFPNLSNYSADCHFFPVDATYLHEAFWVYNNPSDFIHDVFLYAPSVEGNTFLWQFQTQVIWWLGVILSKCHEIQTSLHHYNKIIFPYNGLLLRKFRCFSFYVPDYLFLPHYKCLHTCVGYSNIILFYRSTQLSKIPYEPAWDTYFKDVVNTPGDKRCFINFHTLHNDCIDIGTWLSSLS